MTIRLTAIEKSLRKRVDIKANSFKNIRKLLSASRTMGVLSCVAVVEGGEEQKHFVGKC